MNSPKEPIKGILGVDVRSRHKINEESLDKCFHNPIIHKQIKGDKVMYIKLR